MELQKLTVARTGATGYLGGQALHSLVQSPTGSSHEISVLVRSADGEQAITAAYPQVRIVKGDLEGVDVIEEEAKRADVVYHLASTKDLPSAQAIVRGLGHESRSQPGYWIQISGASMFSGPDIKNKTFGEPSSEVYRDLSDTDKIASVIQSQPQRTVDNLVLSQDRIKTALVIGPLFYGAGQGPGNKNSIQAPETARITIERAEGFQIGAGKSAWSNLHVRDLGSLFERLLHAVTEGNTAAWNQNGVYAAENGKLTFGQLGELIAAEAHKQGLIKSAAVSTISFEEADRAMPHGSVLLATNAVIEAQRAKKQLGWHPTHEPLEDTISEVVKEASKRN